MIKSALGHRLDAWIQRGFPFLFWRRLDPNTLTVVGALVSAVAAGAFAAGAFLAGGVLMLAGGFFDLVDGVVARHQGTSTRFGALLDSTLDRFVDMAVLLGMAVHFAAQGEPGHVALVGAALVPTVLVSYAKARAELELPSFEVGLLERGERVGILAWGAILGYPVVALWIVAIGSTITLIQRFARARRELARLDAADAGAEGERTTEPST